MQELKLGREGGSSLWPGLRSLEGIHSPLDGGKTHWVGLCRPGMVSWWARARGQRMPAEVLMKFGSCLWGLLLNLLESHLGHWLSRIFPVCWDLGDRNPSLGR